MTTIVVTKDDTGKLTGFGEKHRKAYARFRKVIDELQPGELFTLDYWFPRNRKFHGKHFIMLTKIFDAQERFENEDALRMWLQIGAGHCEYVPGKHGSLIAIPKSIAWSQMDDVDFESHHREVKKFLRDKHARSFLWPHLSDQASYDMVEAILMEFE